MPKARQQVKAAHEQFQISVLLAMLKSRYLTYVHHSGIVARHTKVMQYSPGFPSVLLSR